MADKKHNNQVAPQFSTGGNPLDDIINKKEKIVEVINTPTLNLRDYPNGPVIGVVNKGARFKVAPKQTSVKGWTTIKYKNGEACGMSYYFKEV